MAMDRNDICVMIQMLIVYGCPEMLSFSTIYHFFVSFHLSPRQSILNPLCPFFSESSPNSSPPSPDSIPHLFVPGRLKEWFIKENSKKISRHLMTPSQNLLQVYQKNPTFDTSSDTSVTPLRRSSLHKPTIKTSSYNYLWATFGLCSKPSSKSQKNLYH